MTQAQLTRHVEAALRYAAARASSDDELAELAAAYLNRRLEADPLQGSR